MNRFRGRFAVVIAVVMLLAVVAPIHAAAGDVAGRSITSQSAVVLDFETGIMLYGFNEDQQRVPASMAKIVTAYVIYDAVSAGEITFDTVTRISRRASDFSYNTVFTNVPLPRDLAVTIGELFELIIIMSANAAAIALAEAVSGSESAFVDRMNAKAAELEINARFFDSYGGSEDNRISAMGMAQMASALIHDYPEILQIASRRRVTFRGVEYPNSNQLLGQYTGIDGLKTGFTTPAGNCFIGTAVRDERRIISVTMGSTRDGRFPDTTILLNHGFAVADEVIADFYALHFPEPELPEGGYVYPSSANLIVDALEMPLTAFNIEGYHYFKLRDIAALLSDTEKRFSVQWNEEDMTIALFSGMEYTPVGGELEINEDEARWYTPTSSMIYLDGEECDFEVFLIGDNNYFRLRDIGALLDVFIDWDPDTSTVIIATFEPDEVEDVEDAEDEETPDISDEDTEEDGDEEPESEEEEPETGDETTDFDEEAEQDEGVEEPAA